jgi:hypothetical protein
VDAILIQSPTSKLDATGSIPFSLTQGVLTDQPMTVDITSAGIDLAVLEAANTGLVNAAGLLVVDVHVTGTGENRRRAARCGAAGRRSRVAATGAHYSNAPWTPRCRARRCRSRACCSRRDGDALQGTGRVQLENRAVRDIEFVVTATTSPCSTTSRPRLGGCQPQPRTARSAPEGAGLVRLHSARLEVDQWSSASRLSP